MPVEKPLTLIKPVSVKVISRSHSWVYTFLNFQWLNIVFFSALINYAKKDFPVYENKLIAAAEVNSSFIAGYSVSALYSNKAVFSLPISVNLLMNTLIKSVLGEEYSISISSQMMHSKFNKSYSDNTTINAITTAIIFCFLFFPTVALFALHPLRETSTYFKHLQRMTGVTFISYWGTMLFFDMGVMLLLVALIIGGFVSMDEILGFRIYDRQTVGKYEQCIKQ